jgi:hypothetical protein
MKRERPHWPRMMRRTLAASYCDLTVPEFEREVAEGRLPMPVILGKAEHWSLTRLDEALERIDAGGAADWQTKLGLYAA